MYLYFNIILIKQEEINAITAIEGREAPLEDRGQ